MPEQPSYSLRWKIAQAAEIRWWKRYLSRRAPERYLADKAAYWRRLIAQTGMRYAPGAELLDAGCGPAGIFMVLEDAQVTAIDPLLEQYRPLPHFRPEAYPQAHFRALSLEALDYEADFDAVFCLNVINHVADIELSLRKLYHALRPGGRCWLSVDAHRYDGLQLIFHALPGDILHPHQYTLPQYCRLASAAGFRVLKQQRLKRERIFDYYLLELER